MKIAPRRDEIVGRMVIPRPSSSIIRPDETKVSKFVLVDAVGELAAKAGIEPGQIVVPRALGQVIMREAFRPILKEGDVAFFVTQVSLQDFLIQTEGGSEYVPMESEKAAASWGL